MATTEYFNEIVIDQDHKTSMEVEIGRSSFYSGCKTASGEGEDSIYLRIDDKCLIMTREVAGRFVEAVENVGFYHGMSSLNGIHR